MAAEEVPADEARLTALSRVLPVAQAHRAAMDRLAELAATVMDTPVGIVNLIDEQWQHLVGLSGLGEPYASTRQAPAEAGFCRETFRAGTPLYIDDAAADPRFDCRTGVMPLGVAYAGCPLRDADAQMIGTLCVIDTRPRRWRPAHRRALEALAESVVSEVALWRDIDRRQGLLEAFEHAPAAIAVTRGRDHLLDYHNPAYRSIFGDRPLGVPVRDALPGLPGPFFALMDQVLRTGETFSGTDTPIELLWPGEQEPRERFFDFSYSAVRRDPGPRADTPEDHRGLLVVAVEVTDRVQTRRQLQHHARRQSVLQEATAALSAAATPAEVAAAVVARFGRLLATSSVAVWELRETGVLEALDLGAWDRNAQREWVSLPVDASSPAGDAARRREPIWVERTSDWERDYPRLLPMVKGYGYASIDCLPLLAGGRCVGVVALGFVEERVVGDAERADAVSLADQCAQALQRAGLLVAERNARRAAEEFGNVVAALSGATTPAEVAEVVLGHAGELGARSAVVMLRGIDNGEYLDVLAASGPAAPAVHATQRRLPVGAAHPLSHAVRTGEPVWVGSRSKWAWQDCRFTSDETELPAQLAVPLVLAGRAFGVIGMHFGNEVQAFTADQRATLLTLAGQYAQALDRARLHQLQHDVAESLQRSLLPRDLPVLARLDAAARYLPGAVGVQAGGDWYDLLPVHDSRVALAVGDVVGQGAAAAAVMGQLRSALADYLLDGHSPAAALERLDRFARRIPGAAGSTCACLILDWRSGELRWARAGHPPILVLEPQGSCYLEDGAGAVLGVTGRPAYTEASTVITPGTSVLLYTDGLVERRDEVVDDGLARLTAAAAAVRDRAPEALATGLLQEILDDDAPADDIALVVVRLMPPPMHQRLPAEPATLPGLRRTVQEWAETAAMSDDAIGDLQFALGEAVANAVEHAYPEGDGEYSYELARLSGGGVDVRVRDWGTWRPAPEDRGYRGHGLRVIHTLGENVAIDIDPPGTAVHFVLPAPAVATAPSRASRRAPATAGTPAALAVAVAADSPRRTVTITGDLDVDGANAVRHPLLDELAQPGEVVLDLRRTGFVSSAGVGLLSDATAAATASAAARSGGFSVLVAAGSPAARILRLTTLDAVLPVTVVDER